MPSWPIHLAIANKINKKLKLGDDFIIGNILPDSLNGYIVKNITQKIEKNITHYEDKQKNKAPTINLKKFLKENNQNNSIILGYYAHLFTDKFYNEDFHKNHTIIKNNRKCVILNNKQIDLINTPWKLKQIDFNNYGNYLITHNKIGNKLEITQATLENIKKLPFNINESDLKKTIKTANTIIETKNKEETLTIYTKKELDELFEKCYKELLKNLIKIKWGFFIF